MSRRVRVQLDIVIDFDRELSTLPIGSEADAVAISSPAASIIESLCGDAGPRVLEVSLRRFRFSLDDRA